MIASSLSRLLRRGSCAFRFVGILRAVLLHLLSSYSVDNLLTEAETTTKSRNK